MKRYVESMKMLRYVVWIAYIEWFELHEER